MALKDRIDTPPTRVIHGAPCSVGQLLQDLPPVEAEGLRRMLWELGWSATQVHAEVTAEGHSIAWSQIGKHRRGQCRCLPDEM